MLTLTPDAIDANWLIDIATVLLGAVTGAISGAFSMGGGILSKPGIRVLGGTALEAVGTPLPLIIPTTVGALAQYGRQRLVNYSAALWTVPLGVAAAVLGALLSARVPGEGSLLQIPTAALLAFAAIRLIWEGRTLTDPARGARNPIPACRASASQPARYMIVGLVAGGVSGLLGIGGGVALVPAFHRLCGMALKQSIATSLLCVAFFAVPATIAHSMIGNVNWRLALFLTLGALPGAHLGAKFSSRAKDRPLRVATGALLLLISLLYAGGEMIVLLH